VVVVVVIVTVVVEVVGGEGTKQSCRCNAMYSTGVSFTIIDLLVENYLKMRKGSKKFIYLS